jgi:UDP-glucose 6-dehydrogenase
LSYGFGFGGPCFPRDNKALGLFARNNDYSLLLSEATDEINKRHLAFQLQEFLNKYSEDEKIIFDGITYKKGSLLLDESQQFALAFLLAKAGRKVVLRDQEVVLTAIKKDYETLFDYEPIR